MRLLIDARPFADPKTGGVGRVGAALTKTLAEHFPEVEIVLATTGWQAPESLRSALNLSDQFNINHVHLKLPNKLWSLLSFLSLISLDKEIEKRTGKIDAIFLPNLGFVGRLKKPYLLLIHDLAFKIEPRWFPLKTRWWHKAVRAEKLIAGAAHLLAVSATTKRDAIELLNVGPEKISVIPLGSTLQPAEPKDADHKTTPTQRVVLAFGAGDPRKNSSTARLAVDGLKKNPAFADLKLILIGDQLKPTDTELKKLFSQAAAFLYPSWYEGYGLPLHEAAAFGTPCIASFAGALPETAPLGTIYADPAKPHQWIEALRITLAKETQLKKITQPKTWDEAVRILKHNLDCLIGG